jgi:tRNA threonylcarbamoyladenosine biosynthesis protein TsaE
MDTIYTQEQVVAIAKSVLEYAALSDRTQGATVIALVGELGAGKTTLVQAISRMLGVTETVVSPTFTIAKFYETNDLKWQKLIHIDAYRIEDQDELEPLGFDDLVATLGTIMIVEWPEQIKEALPLRTLWFTIEHYDNMRHITHF